MGAARYVPERGDLVWLEFDPQAGHEQAGHRPALVLSPAAYNRRARLMLCVPVTSRAKGYPFEVAVRAGRIDGVALADQVKSLDWGARRARREGRAPGETVSEVLARLRALLRE